MTHRRQAAVRGAAVGHGAALLVVAPTAPPRRALQTTTATPAPVAPIDPGVELVRALAWPLTAMLIAFLFRRPLSAFVSALGARVTKLSLFKVELELVPAAPIATSPLLDDIRSATTSALISDSSRAMLEQVQTSTPADYAMIALGNGDQWITSRLYIGALMLARMRGIRALVFVERAPSTERRFVATASVESVRWALARRYPHLEAAWVRANLNLFWPGMALAPTGGIQAAWSPDPRMVTFPQPLFTTATGGLEPFAARQLVSRFIDSLQRPAPADPSGILDEWIPLGRQVEEKASWVTRELLTRLLPPDVFLSWNDELRDASRAKRTRAVLRRTYPFVALTHSDREFVRLVDRTALLEDVAASLGEEPDAAGA